MQFRLTYEEQLLAPAHSNLGAPITPHTVHAMRGQNDGTVTSLENVTSSTAL
jgi:hypothetical protein